MSGSLRGTDPGFLIGEAIRHVEAFAEDSDHFIPRCTVEEAIRIGFNLSYFHENGKEAYRYAWRFVWAVLESFKGNTYQEAWSAFKQAMWFELRTHGISLDTSALLWS